MAKLIQTSKEYYKGKWTKVGFYEIKGKIVVREIKKPRA